MPDDQTLNEVLKAYGVANPLTAGGGINWWNIMGGIIFGIIGWYAFMHGWKQKSIRPSIIGIALMIYPYFVPNTILFYIIGIALTAALYYWRE